MHGQQNIKTPTQWCVPSRKRDISFAIHYWQHRASYTTACLSNVQMFFKITLVIHTKYTFAQPYIFQGQRRRSCVDTAVHMPAGYLRGTATTCERISKDGMQPGARNQATAGRIRPAALSHSWFEPICRWTLNITVLVCGGTCNLVYRSQRTDGTCCLRLHRTAGSFEKPYLLTPWCRVLLEKPTGLHLVKKFPAFLWKPKVHYRTHKRPPPVPILGQPNPVHIPTFHLLEIHPNIIHPSTPRSPQWSLSLRFPHQDPIRPPLLTHTRHVPSPSHFSRFYQPHNTGWGIQII